MFKLLKFILPVIFILLPLVLLTGSAMANMFAFPLVILNFYIIMSVVVIQQNFNRFQLNKTNFNLILTISSVIGLTLIIFTNIYPLFHIHFENSYIPLGLFLLGLVLVVSSSISSLYLSKNVNNLFKNSKALCSSLIVLLVLFSILPFLFFQSIVFYYNPYFRSSVPVLKISCNDKTLIVKPEWNSGGYATLFTQQEFNNMDDVNGFGSVSIRSSNDSVSYSSPQFNDKATQELKDCVNKEVRIN